MSKRRGERVLFSVVGQRYDAPGQWRPTLVCVQRPDVLEVDRLVLLGQANARATTESLAKAVREVNPAIEVERVTLELRDAWSFEEVYGAFYEFARARTFREEDEHYVHMTTGTHVMQIVWYLLVSEHFVPAKLVQSAPPKRSAKDTRGTIDVLDLDLSRYPAIERRRHRERLEGQSLLKMGIETRSQSFDRVIQRLERAARGCGCTRFESSNARSRGRSSRSTARPCAGRCERAPSSATSAGRSRAQTAIGEGICGPQTEACSFSTRSASSGSRSKRSC
jgi:sigma54-dependent transcription regulator